MWKFIHVSHQSINSVNIFLAFIFILKTIIFLRTPNSTNFYLFKVKIKNIWRRSGVFIVNSEHISYLFLQFVLLTLNK